MKCNVEEIWAGYHLRIFNYIHRLRTILNIKNIIVILRSNGTDKN